MSKNYLFLVLLTLILSCKKKIEHRVAFVENQEKFIELRKLNLDKKYTSLFKDNTPNKIKKDILIKWRQFHHRTGELLKKEKFNWEVKDSFVKIFSRVYFNKNGKVEFYKFKVLSKNIPYNKKLELEKILNKNIKKLRINLTRKEKFSQCGTIKFKTNE